MFPVDDVIMKNHYTAVYRNHNERTTFRDDVKIGSLFRLNFNSSDLNSNCQIDIEAGTYKSKLSWMFGLFTMHGNYRHCADIQWHSIYYTERSQ